MNDRKYSTWAWVKAYAAMVLTAPVFGLLWLMATFVRRLPQGITHALHRAVMDHMMTHRLDLRIPPDKEIPAYMLRWWWLPRNAFFNVYLHHVLRSDDDRALHDHPWWSFSLVLNGGYNEHMIEAGGVHSRKWFGAGAMRFRLSGKVAHRLELAPDEESQNSSHELDAVTIFITGPVLRRWGFHHPTGWIDAYDWDDFCAANGIQSMKMGGGSQAVISERNKHT